MTVSLHCLYPSPSLQGLGCPLLDPPEQQKAAREAKRGFQASPHHWPCSRGALGRVVQETPVLGIVPGPRPQQPRDSGEEAGLGYTGSTGSIFVTTVAGVNGNGVILSYCCQRDVKFIVALGVGEGLFF